MIWYWIIYKGWYAVKPKQPIIHAMFKIDIIIIVHYICK